MLNSHDPVTDNYFSCTTNLREWKVPLSGENPVMFRSYEIGNQENTATKTNDELNNGICPKHFYKTMAAVFKRVF